MRIGCMSNKCLKLQSVLTRMDLDTIIITSTAVVINLYKAYIACCQCISLPHLSTLLFCFVSLSFPSQCYQNCTILDIVTWWCFLSSWPLHVNISKLEGNQVQIGFCPVVLHSRDDFFKAKTCKICCHITTTVLMITSEKIKSLSVAKNYHSI